MEFKILIVGVEEAEQILSWAKLDLLVLNLETLGPSGLTLIRRVRADAPLAKVLALGAEPDQERELRAVGCDRLLPKPLAREPMVEAMCMFLLEKDAEEVQQILPGLAESGGPAREWPRADVLLLEPDLGLTRALMRLLRDPLVAEGMYFILRTAQLEHALKLLADHKPHLVVADLSLLSSQHHPDEVVQRLLACETQPRDYVFFMHAGDRNRHLLDSVPGKRWVGDP
ncbi:MAG: hypothetical protein NC910_02750 [Candidatus Omnitrophica bacterium]|nr:hypothetical protein [Candidatus Omnitrophota bacterium]